MRALFDTHALIWWFSDDPSLRQSIRETIADTDNLLLVSAASAWELAIKYQLGKLRKVADLVSNFSGRVGGEGFELLPISAEHGIRAGLLSGHHKDPFDRMLIAQCQAENIPIISNDLIFERYGVRRLW
ncbi:MAG: type II toxin-antitoxin system VapC family toxin [Acidobacteriia bacterium]|nr:type II toxin-antitoxin system VapC family toxin [Terriglobia bacterium]